MRPINLQEHPEGGRYKEVYRSKSSVHTSVNKMRSALTHIYFSLNKGEISLFHKVKSDEVWNLYEGEELLLYLWNEETEKLDSVKLSKQYKEYCHVVPAGIWQAAKSTKGTVLVGCSVAPGFEFEDFELMDINTEEAKSILQKYPLLKNLIIPYQS